MMPHPTPTSYDEAQAQLDAIYKAHVASGRFFPILYPWCIVGPAVIILYLLVPHQKHPALEKARYLVWAINTAFCLYCLTHARLRIAYGYGGLIFAWSIEWTTVLLIAHDAQRDFWRLERRSKDVDNAFISEILQEREQVAAKLSEVDDSSHKSEDRELTEAEQALSARAQRLLEPSEGLSKDGLVVRGMPPLEKARRHLRGKYKWVYYSSATPLERVYWTLDIFTQLRGIGWNWQIAGSPPLPWEVQLAAGNDKLAAFMHVPSVGRDGIRRAANRKECVRMNLVMFLGCYVAIDIMKTITILDPYFWGIIDSPGPSFLPIFFRNSSVLLKMYRQLVFFLTIKYALQMMFALGPLIFVGLLGPDRIGIFGEYWMYPTLWGDFSHVLEKGLAGFWSRYWHQSFRFSFEANSNFLASKLFPMLPSKSPSRMLCQSMLVFALSGCLHASGSCLQLGPTEPLRPMIFFLLQPLGIALQVLLSRALSSLQLQSKMANIGIPRTTVKLLKQLANYVFTHVWLYHTASLLLDDFARGGIPLVEMPVSLLRGFGLAGPDYSWWCWGGEFVRWHRGEHWWQSGIVL